MPNSAAASEGDQSWEKPKKESTMLEPIRHPGLIMAIGTVCIRWSYLEALLATYYALMVFGKELDAEYNRKAYLAVIDGYESIATWAMKRKLIVAATRRRVDDATADKLDDLLKRIGKRQQRRNSVVHARWFKSEKPDEWMRHRTLASNEEPEPYNLRKFSDLGRDILKDYNDLAAFFERTKPLLLELGIPLYLSALIAYQEKPPDTLKGALGGI